MTTEISGVPASDADRIELVPIAEWCSTSTCPTVYSSSRGTVVVQGYEVTAGVVGFDLPHGEALVEIPESLLAAAARRVSAGDVPSTRAEEIRG